VRELVQPDYLRAEPMSDTYETFDKTSAAAAKRPSVPISVAVGVAAVGVATLISWVGLDHRHLTDVVMVYLLGVVVVAMRFNHVASLVAAALGVAAFDFFFTTPYFSLAVDDKRLFLTFTIMLALAVLISTLAERIRRGTAIAVERELRTSTLYAMTRELSTASSQEEIVRVSRRHLRRIFGADVSVFLAAGDGALREVDSLTEADPPVVARARAVFAGTAPAERPRPADPMTCVLLRGSKESLGVVVLRASAGTVPSFDPAGRDVLEALAGQTALALERARLADEEQRAQLEIQRERLRNALLSSVSHDLRTPIAVLKGAATALLESHDQLSSVRRREYLVNLSDEASRLNLLVENLLSVTSLEAGALRVRKQWQPLEETVGVALSRLEGELRDRAVEIAIADDASLVAFDPVLVEQVFVNLVENAIKYTPDGTPIEIRAQSVEGGVEVEIADEGPGVPEGQEERIFGKFQRAVQTPSGMGLGLAICRGILTVHGGRIWCRNRPSGGSAFHFVLPRVERARLEPTFHEALDDR
jgi:two-component system sensor histidine kinase KdpD